MSYLFYLFVGYWIIRALAAFTTTAYSYKSNHYLNQSAAGSASLVKRLDYQHSEIVKLLDSFADENESDFN